MEESAMAFKDIFSNLFSNEDDEMYEEDYYDEEYETVEPNQTNNIQSVSQSNPSTSTVENTEEINRKQTKESSNLMANEANRNKVVNFNDSRKPAATVEIFKPRIFAEAERISQSLLAGKSVILNLAQMSDEDARRFVDYMTGVVYAINGDLQRVASEVFVAVPETVEIEGLYEEYTNPHANSGRERGNIWEREGGNRE